MNMKKQWLLLGAGLLMALAMTITACTTLSDQRASVLKLPVPVTGAQFVGSEACADCHEELVATFSGSIHDRILAKETAIGMKGCETCHGPASLHVDSEDPAQIIAFENLDAGTTSAVCLRCHSDGEHFDWAGTSHPMNDVGCLSCHKIHNPPVAKNSLEKAEPELCYECHALVKQGRLMQIRRDRKESYLTRRRERYEYEETMAFAGCRVADGAGYDHHGLYDFE